jgi:hypothetical protein
MHAAALSINPGIDAMGQKGTWGSAVSKGRVKSRQPISLIRSGCAHSADLVDR